jgi:hypothetical protein
MIQTFIHDENLNSTNRIHFHLLIQSTKTSKMNNLQTRVPESLIQYTKPDKPGIGFGGWWWQRETLLIIGGPRNAAGQLKLQGVQARNRRETRRQRCGGRRRRRSVLGLGATQNLGPSGLPCPPNENPNYHRHPKRRYEHHELA